MNENYLIYSVEDDPDISEIISLTLNKQGYMVKSFADGESFLKAFHEKKPDLILLDLMLPGIQGNEIIKKIRDKHENDEIEIIVISAKHLVKDKVNALDLGADDYLEKPFDLLELMSRVNAHLRHTKSNSFYVFGDLALNEDTKTFLVKGHNVALTPNEYEIMRLFMKNPGKTISRESLAITLYNDAERANGKSLDMHIRSLRNKLTLLGENVLVSIYGSGYKLVENE